MREHEANEHTPGGLSKSNTNTTTGSVNIENRKRETERLLMRLVGNLHCAATRLFTDRLQVRTFQLHLLDSGSTFSRPTGSDV